MTTPPVLKEDSPIWQEYLKDANGRNLSPVSMKYLENGDPVEFWLNLNQLWEDVALHERSCGVKVT